MTVSGMYPQTQHRMELHSNSAPANRARRYVLTLTLDASAPMPYIVSTQWGRSGWFLRGESYTVPDEHAALAQMRTLLKRRRAHGYSVVSVDTERRRARVRAGTAIHALGAPLLRARSGPARDSRWAARAGPRGCALGEGPNLRLKKQIALTVLIFMAL